MQRVRQLLGGFSKTASPPASPPPRSCPRPKPNRPVFGRSARGDAAYPKQLANTQAVRAPEARPRLTSRQRNKVFWRLETRGACARKRRGSEKQGQRSWAAGCVGGLWMAVCVLVEA